MIRSLATLSALLLWTCAATAQSFPALYDVTGVAVDDVLNVRRDPDSGSAIVGDFAPTTIGIEVLGADATGKWARVNAGESQGWTALGFLAPAGDPNGFPDTDHLTCSGTEPFWSLTAPRNGPAELDLLGGEKQAFDRSAVYDASGRPDRYVLDLGDRATAVIRRAAWSDGMSDMGFGLDIDLIVRGARPTLYSGCCTIAQH